MISHPPTKLGFPPSTPKACVFLVLTITFETICRMLILSRNNASSYWNIQRSLVIQKKQGARASIIETAIS
ncbi:hypothetical protein BDQ94DRAFT_25118 [Aspergillus welwitschiae]|uniref:Uncharacterized protein n=1 Tax=Aspergillus welwitschiae TaxID=1341132 RepID=A0A3F3Q5H2_9EURO|nr:hypothetical protein BDQ94DRAFT_25118 [Aspergillus welwitschiae]RDH34297.1 hypothetical protein BDQ94DRAFT_25118 [Aspergillus welwitschiae]